MQEAGAEERPSGPAIHDALEQLSPRVEAFDQALTPRHGAHGDHRVPIKRCAWSVATSSSSNVAKFTNNAMS